MLGRGGDGAGRACAASTTGTRSEWLDLPGSGGARVSSYDAGGRLESRSSRWGGRVRARVLPGGFTIAER